MLGVSTPKILMIDEDRTLAVQTADGNEAAFTQLFHKHYAWVYAKAYKILANNEDAEDAASIILQKVWVKLNEGKWDPEKGAFTAWLNTVAHNTILDKIRQIKRRPYTLMDNEETQNSHRDSVLDTALDLKPCPEQNAISAETLYRIENALEKIANPTYRLAFILRHLEEYSIRDIARILQIKEGTAKIAVFRGKEEVKSLLTPIKEWL